MSEASTTGFPSSCPTRSRSACPSIFDWPEHVAAGASSNRWAANIDILPTVLAAAGISPNPAYPIDGRSLLAPDRRSHMFFEYYNDPANGSAINGWASIRTDTYQYIEDYNNDGSLLMREYYNLANDPWEIDNLYADGVPGNDPPVTPLHDQLAADRACKGRTAPDTMVPVEHARQPPASARAARLSCSPRCRCR